MSKTILKRSIETQRSLKRKTLHIKAKSLEDLLTVYRPGISTRDWRIAMDWAAKKVRR